MILFGAYLVYRFFREKGDVPVSMQAERFKGRLEDEQIMYREKILSQELNNQQFIDFMTSWVHDIKTPLTVLALSVDSKQKQQVVQIESKINQMLFYTKYTSFYEDLHLEKVELRMLIEKLLKQYANLFISQKLVVDLKFADMGTILTDKLWASFVIEQIISNALKYAGEGKCIFITTFETETVAGVEIKNTGNPISSSDLPRIFERGYTGRTREFGKSTGMGLFLSKEIIKKLGGEVLVSNESMTTFKVIFKKSFF